MNRPTRETRSGFELIPLWFESFFIVVVGLMLFPSFLKIVDTSNEPFWIQSTAALFYVIGLISWALRRIARWTFGENKLEEAENDEQPF